jgi:hypothetical protein
MRTITFMFFLILSKIAFSLTITNTTNKDFILKNTAGENLIIASNTSSNISDELADSLEIALAVSVASMYKIQDVHHNNMLFIRDSDKDVLFNIKINSHAQSYHSSFSKYQDITIRYWDQAKDDDSLLVILTKKPAVEQKDVIDAKLNLKCSIF